MSYLVRFGLDGGDEVLVEVADDAFGVAPVARDPGSIATAPKKLESALAVIRPVARSVLESLHGLDLQERQVEFGVSLSGETGAAFIARAGADVHFQITLISRAGPAGESEPTGEG